MALFLEKDGIENFCRLLEEESGLSYRADKAYLFESRLRPLFHGNQVQDYWALCRLWQQGQSLRQSIVEALVTSETYFFRDPTTFTALPQLLPAAQAKSGTTHIWSVGCSSGQEACSILMSLVESGWESHALQVLGLDLSQAMVEKARSASFTELELSRGMDAARIQRHMESCGEVWRLRPTLRQSLHFQVLNVVKELPSSPDPSLVMMRNLLIYFSPETRVQVLRKVVHRLPMGGCLVLGNSEQVDASITNLERLQEFKASIYRKVA